MQRRYVTTDVFTDRVFGGNPLAVVLDAEGLTTEQMQAIAREFNYSETTFVLPPRDPAHTAEVRIFTPMAEMPFAGHPNVGTAYVLARELGLSGSIVFEEKAGLVPITLTEAGGTVVGSELTAPQAFRRGAASSAADVARCVSLAEADIRTDRHAPTVASVGLPFIVAELTDRDALRRAVPSVAAFQSMMPFDGADAVFVYARGNDAGAIDARMFAPLDNILEDPATGSAAGAVTGLLASLDNAADGTLTFRISQGEDMGRSSLIATQADKRGGTVIAVRVGGRCVEVMRGSFVLAGAAP